MDHPAFNNVPHDLAVAYLPAHEMYVVLHGDGPPEQRQVVMHNPDPAELQQWLDAQSREINPQQGWDVYLHDKKIDTVFFSGSMGAFEVVRSLVDHDGYDPGIAVRRSSSTPPPDPIWTPEISTWDIYLHGKKIGEAAYSDEVEHDGRRISAEQVRRWAIQNDRYDPAITVRRTNPYHGRKHNGAGLGAFLGSLGAGVVGAAIVGTAAAPFAVLMSMAGGGVGGYYGAQDDRKKRGAIGGAAGGVLGPLFAALGGWIGGRHPDETSTKRRNPDAYESLSAAVASNPDVSLSYDEALARIESGDIGVAAAWIGHVGVDHGEDEMENRMTDAALAVLRQASIIEVEESVTLTTTLRVANPAEANPHEHKWWEAEGHCCEACAVAQPCSGEAGCELPVAKANPKGRGGKKRRK